MSIWSRIGDWLTGTKLPTKAEQELARLKLDHAALEAEAKALAVNLEQERAETARLRFFRGKSPPLSAPVAVEAPETNEWREVAENAQAALNRAEAEVARLTRRVKYLEWYYKGGGRQVRKAWAERRTQQRRAAKGEAEAQAKAPEPEPVPEQWEGGQKAWAYPSTEVQ